MEKEMIRRQLTLDKGANDYLDLYMEKHGVKKSGEAVIRIFKEHEQAKQMEWSLEKMTEEVLNNLQPMLNSELTKIKLGANSADKNTQILIEIMNGVFFHQSIGDIIPTETEEMKGITTARKAVDERINKARQKRLDWEENRRKNKE